MGSEDGSSINAVHRTFDVIEGLKELERTGVTDLADEVSLPASTVYNYLQTLEERKYVVKDDGQYRLANRFIHLGDHTKHRLQLFRSGKPSINQLIERTGETANLVVEEYGRGIYLLSETREAGLRNYSHVRRREYLHSTAAGKAILLELPADRVDDVIDEHGLPERTNRTITDREELLEHLEEARDRGYTWNLEENTEGVRAVGAPIENPSGSYAAVSVAAPVNRVPEDRLHDELATAVRNTAKSINLELRS